ncbi:Insulinase-like:Peptidase M16, C-terminal precursor [Croceitalea dokdonensis DOKDO 023]|uniref:Insulinase-like:Peptidase M16, C-terminal n=1 Tax=Croceitalea dokdonensis DOKDO 023 TaxID=1300341 RepID=A0A0P7ALS2_9FLAO|nr:pitrilysin family protein [Croceitalea dokdonensis]KPM32865.1 Insulinase-like:Peptidase M16, C-terminal precursor [Croceitalea dokdonensis DOKDO 023]
MKKTLLFTILSLFLTVSYAQIDRTQPPKPGPAPKINLEEPNTFELKNGLKVMVVENRKLPRVSIQLDIDNPPVLEGDKAGVSSLMASMLGNGSSNIPKDEFNEEVDFLGARLSFGASSAFASSLSKYFPRILELMADAAINPNFTAEEFEKEKAKLITGLKTEENDVSAIADKVQRALAYGTKHPYGEITSEETVNNVTLFDVEQFYRKNFVPANAYLVIIGDVDFKTAKDLVTKAFTPWTRAVPPTYSYSKPMDAQYTQINFVDMPNAVQSEVAVQNLVDLKMKDDDYLPALIANQILGGGGEGRLFLNLREDKGYTYGSYSSIGNDRFSPVRFTAEAQVRNMVTDSSVVQILEEIDRITKEPVTAEELKNTKAKYAGRFVMALEQPQTIARYALNIEKEGLPKDFYKNYLQNINAISVADVQNAAKKYFSTDKARVVVAGKGSEVLENLEKVSFNGKAVPVLYFDKNANKTEKPDYNAGIPEGITANDVLNKYIEAIGGAEKVNAITSLKLVYEGEAMGSKIKVEEKRTADKLAQTTYMNENPMMGVVAKGDELFMKQGGNKMPLPEDMKADMMNTMGIFVEQALLANGTAKLAGIEQVDGKDAYKLEVPGKITQTSLFYDVETGLKVKEAAVITMNGQSQNQSGMLKEYKEIDGIMFPSIKTQSMGPQEIEVTLLEAVINQGVTDADFE